MGSLAENLTPPYYAAVLNETQDGLKDGEHIAPADEMVTLATRQPGFLGLETAKDKEGAPITVSYWRDIDDIERGMVAGDDSIHHRFGLGLAETCGIKVSQVEHPGELPRSLGHLRASPKDAGVRSFGTYLLAAFGSLLSGIMP